ncbi:uncharacterized protein PITG_15108 [Phytophthora infestans T30-4]|uniref:Uncharacterized protein n=1 Tax=Phytophthora infestans (strain T30-4) TaxID=403677 RepID=D0NRP1_PHYIT|nr:uncharacterized protein PITG_15108 [Phytophthora infestans T30-4]EEY63391.1 hypothetical protein PITG_15108 [Phytophthora infestans T30-4]|eukprot:XP_002898276.1 hypothetical protein PITG_15108 [Phytophthora infestans T30-4]
MCGSLVSSALGPPPQIPRGPASQAPRAGLLWLRASPPLALVGRDRFVAISEIEHCGQMFVNKSRVHLTHRFIICISIPFSEELSSCLLALTNVPRVPQHNPFA